MGKRKINENFESKKTAEVSILEKLVAEAVEKVKADYPQGLVTLPEKYVVLPEKYVAGLVTLPEKYVVLSEKYVAGLVCHNND